MSLSESMCIDREPNIKIPGFNLDEDEVIEQLTARGEKIDQMFIDEFGRLDYENEYLQAEDKEEYFTKRIRFWKRVIAEDYGTKTLNDVEDQVDRADLKLRYDMLTDLRSKAAPYVIDAGHVFE